jgi:hypothetical protein
MTLVPPLPIDRPEPEPALVDCTLSVTLPVPEASTRFAPEPTSKALPPVLLAVKVMPPAPEVRILLPPVSEMPCVAPAPMPETLMLPPAELSVARFIATGRLATSVMLPAPVASTLAWLAPSPSTMALPVPVALP